MSLKRPFSDIDWITNPEPVKQHILYLERTIENLTAKVQQIEKRIEQLEVRTKKNSQKSSKPPSSDGPFVEPKKETKKRKRKRGGQKGHKGYRQQLPEPTDVQMLLPGICSCGKHDLDPKSIEPYYTHQHIELPEIRMDIRHFGKGRCNHCGNTVRAQVPVEYRSGYGSRLSATVSELSGSHGSSRQMVQDFCQSVLSIPISVGGIHRIIDRASEALRPVYEEIGRQAHNAQVNHIDETSWMLSGKLNWLWTMVNHEQQPDLRWLTG